MARDIDAEEGSETHGTGIGERVTGGVKRAVGAIGRAARGVMGQPETGTDALYRALHADHEEVAQQFQKMFDAGNDRRAEQLWGQLSLNLIAHARAEQDVVYARLAQEETTREQLGESYDEHDDIFRLLAECDALGVGTDEFYALATELEQVVRHHVDGEEGDLLPLAADALAEEERDDLVVRFQARKQKIMPEIREELGIGDGPAKRQPQRSDRSVSAGGQRVPDSAERRRSAKRAGSRTPDRSDELSRMTVSELRRMASDKDIRGRSRMDKQELMAALRRG